MSQLPTLTENLAYCGIDVSALTLAVAIHRPDQPIQQREFANDARGHKALIGWLGKSGPVRVAIESTGIYSMDLAVALDGAEGIEVTVLNPKMVHRFAGTLRRSKTDRADALALCEYCRRMPFTAWRAPAPNLLQLRSLIRYIAGLTAELQRGKNRLHAARGSSATPACLIKDLRQALISQKRRILALRREAMELVRLDPALSKRFELLISIPGIARVSALQLLGELTLLSEDMPVRQWVAHSGLDPSHQVSGTSVHKPSRIRRAGNRHLRRALYMPALVAARHDVHIKVFYNSLIHRHKAKMQALIAVARKLLHAIYGVLKTNSRYDGQKLFPHLLTQ